MGRHFRDETRSFPVELNIGGASGFPRLSVKVTRRLWLGWSVSAFVAPRGFSPASPALHRTFAFTSAAWRCNQGEEYFMPTINQLVRKGRVPQKVKSKVPAMEQNPQ